MRYSQIERLDETILEHLEHFTDMPVVVFNETGLLYSNDQFAEAIHEQTISPIFHNIFNDIDPTSLDQDQKIHIKNSVGEVFWFKAILKRVVFKNIPSIYAILVDIRDEMYIKTNLNQIEKLRSLIIEISDSILDTTNISEFYDYILSTTLKAIDKTTLGTILLLDGDILYPAANVGFHKEVMDLRINLKQTFIYQATEGKMDRIVNIPDLALVENYIRVRTEYGEEVQIESTLSAPFYFRDELFGFINIDSLKKDAFDENDVQAIEFIVKSIEIAITNRLLYEEKAYLSRYDRVTGLYNRHFFDEQSNLIIKKALRYQESFHLVMIDIDNLKTINDDYSHLVGDEIIALVANNIKKNLRESDIFVRYGGDEFVGILFNSQTESLNEKFELMNRELSQECVQFNNQDIYSSISYGIAKFKEDGETIYDLIRVADDRMYDQKLLKKDKVTREV